MKKKLLIFIGSISIAFILPFIYILFQILPITIYQVVADDMEPTLTAGQEVGINEFDTDYKRGEIVIFKKTLQGKEKILIKRIVGLPGEMIEAKNGDIFISGDILEEDYAINKSGAYLDIKLEDDEFFLLGDNRSRSLDSRIFGPIKKDQILGTVRILEDNDTN